MKTAKFYIYGKPVLITDLVYYSEDNWDCYFFDINGRVKSSFDTKDSRIDSLCHRSYCDGRHDVVISYRAKNYTDRHVLYCSTCGFSGFNLPIVVNDPGEWVIPFGKHKNKQVKDVDKSYLIWCVNKLGDDFKKPKSIFKQFLGMN